MWVLRFGVSVVSPHLHKEAVSVLGFSSLIRAPGLLRALRWALRTREVWGRRPPGAPHQGGPRAASQREPLPGRAGTAPPCGGGDPTARGRAVTPRRFRSPKAVNGRSRPTPHPDPGGGRRQRRTWLLGSARLEEPLLAARAGRGSAGAPSGLASPGGKAKAQPVAAAADESRSRLRPCFPPGGDPAPPLSAGPAPPRPAGVCRPATRGRCALVRPPGPRLPSPSGAPGSPPSGSSEGPGRGSGGRFPPRPRTCRQSEAASRSAGARPAGCSVPGSAVCAGPPGGPRPAALKVTARFRPGSPPTGRNRIATFRSNLGAEDQRGSEPQGW